MNTRGVLIFSLLLSLTLAEIGLADTPLVSGIAALSRGDTGAGYPLLERAFSTESTAEGKTRAAYLLALAPPKRLKRARHLYALYVLDHDTKLSAADRFSLLRVAGDGLFDEGKVIEAKADYEQALKLAGISDDDREYVSYRLGWVELNLEQPALAYARWDSWTESHPRAESALRKLMVKDMGRAWAENALHESSKPLALEAQLSVSEEQALFEGVVSGIHRASDPGYEKLATFLASSPMFTRLATYLFSTTDLFDAKPCAVLAFVEQRIALASGAREQLLSCAGASMSDVALMKRLAPAFLRLELKDVARWTKARVLYAAGRSSEACAELGNLVGESVSAGMLDHLEGIAADVVADCATAAGKPLIAAVDGLYRSPAVAAALQKSPEHLFKPLAAFAAFAPIRATVLEAVLATPQLWKASELPVQLLELHSQELGSQKRLLFAFADPKRLEEKYAPFVAGYIGTRLKNKQVAEALSALNRWCPLEQANTLWSMRLWGALSLMAPEKVSQSALSSAYLRVLGAIGANEKTIEAHDARALAISLLNIPDLAAVWRSWPLVGASISKDSDLSTVLVAGTLRDLPKLSEVLAAASNTSPEARYFIAVEKLLAAPTGAIQSALPREPRLLQGQAVAKDATVLQRIRALELSYMDLKLAKGARLASVLGHRISSLKAKLQAARRQRWSSQAFVLAAERSITEMSSRLATAIDQVASTDPDQATDLKALSQVLRSWHVAETANGGQRS